MAQIKISALGTGTPQGTDLTPATDTTDLTQAASGTTKKYVRSDEFNYYMNAQGLATKSATRVATTGALTVVYANGALGVGATLTNAGAMAALTIDGVSLAVSDRVLVKDQAAPAQNGIYTVTTVGSGAVNWVMTRATDYDQAAEIAQYQVVLVNQGTLNAGLAFQQTGTGPWTMGTTAIVFAAFTINSISLPLPLAKGGTSAALTAVTNGIVYSGASALAITAAGNNGILVTSAAGLPSIGNTVLADLTINTVTVGLGTASIATNTAVGTSSLSAVTTASQSVAVGYQALQANTTGIGATAVGHQALNANTTGTASTAIGSNCLPLCNGNNNTAVGSGSGLVVSTGAGNTLVGTSAGSPLTTGSSNTIIGTNSGTILVSGSDNILIGGSCQTNNAASTGTIGIGQLAVTEIATGLTSGDAGPGIAIGSATYPVGFRGDGTIYSGGTGRGYWRLKVNGTKYLSPLFIDGTLTARASMTTDTNGSPILTGAMADGAIVIGATAGNPTAGTITAGTGITVTNAANSITLAVSGGGLATATIAGTTQSAAVNTTYIALNVGQTTLNLPAVYAVGDIIRLVGSTANTGGWIVTAAAGDTVRVLNSTTSAGGTVTSTAQAGEVIEIICDVANTSWITTSFVSTLLTTA